MSKKMKDAEVVFHKEVRPKLCVPVFHYDDPQHKKNDFYCELLGRRVEIQVKGTYNPVGYMTDVHDFTYTKLSKRVNSFEPYTMVVTPRSCEEGENQIVVMMLFNLTYPNSLKKWFVISGTEMQEIHKKNWFEHGVSSWSTTWESLESKTMFTGSSLKELVACLNTFFLDRAKKAIVDGKTNIKNS